MYIWLKSNINFEKYINLQTENISMELPIFTALSWAKFVWKRPMRYLHDFWPFLSKFINNLQNLMNIFAIYALNYQNFINFLFVLWAWMSCYSQNFLLGNYLWQSNCLAFKRFRVLTSCIQGFGSKRSCSNVLGHQRNQKNFTFLKTNTIWWLAKN